MLPKASMVKNERRGAFAAGRASGRRKRPGGPRGYAIRTAPRTCTRSRSRVHGSSASADGPESIARAAR